jgi:type IV pilus assembly protein PilA
MREGGSRVLLGGSNEGSATVGAAARGRPRLWALSDDCGFTFVELLAALLILGILVALAIPSYFGSENTARSKFDQSNVQAINAALALYKFNNGGACPPDQTTFAGAAFLGNTTYFPDGSPADPWCGSGVAGVTCTSSNPSLPYQNSYNASLCRVQMVYGGGLIDHTAIPPVGH